MLLFIPLNNTEGEEEGEPTGSNYRMLRGMGVFLPVLAFFSSRGR